MSSASSSACCGSRESIWPTSWNSQTRVSIRPSPCVIRGERLVTTSLGRLVRPGAHAGRGPVVTDAPAPSHDAPRSAGTARRVATEAVAAAVIATVTLLCLLQAPNAIAWALDGPGGVGTGAQGSTIAVLRAAGLALPAMAALAGIAALAVLRLRAWPVLLAGLLVMAVADALGGSARTVTVIAVVR